MNQNNLKEKNFTAGYLLILVLVFGSIFFTIISSFTVFIVTQSQLISQRVEFENAGQIAEAGLNYYKWYLAHYPNDVTNGTGLPGPYVGVYSDPEGGAIGEYSLSIASTTFCGDVASIRVTSVGHTYSQPNVKRTITARYTKPTVVDYAFTLNSNVWDGPDRMVNGPYHSNGGIRFDGTNNGSVTSGQTNWVCDSSYGCSPTGSRNGVFTTTGNPNTALFNFPASNIDFNGITVDLSQMKTRAQNNGGLYIPPSGGSNAGYRVTFNSNNTVTVQRVTSTIQHRGYTTEDGWDYERNIMNNTSLVGTYAIPSSCPLIYIEDKVWLEGTVASKVAIAAASDTATNPSMILQGNITYTSATSSGLLAIAEHDVLIGVTVPNDMYINGIFIAKNGKYGRNFYCGNTAYCSNANLLPYSGTDYRPYAIQNSENFNGTIVSNGRVGTQWTSGGNIISGFLTRNNTYDRNLVDSPPPLIPTTSDDYEFSDWQDVN